MPPGAHALLSPSSASRWLACTPSARLEAEFPEKAGSDASAEGTLAHDLGEHLILAKLGRITSEAFGVKLEEIQKHKHYSPEMYSYIDAYADYVLEQFNAAKSVTKDATLLTEQKLDLTDYIPEGFGTGDVIIIADGTLHIIDLKYGKGVAVSAVGNKQMRVYGLGALKIYDFMYDIQNVRKTIYQPRLDSITTDEMSVEELRMWAETELMPKAVMAYDGKGEFAVGDHCRFCKAKAVCRALADYNLEIAKHEFAKPALLDDAEVADVLNRADMFTKWIAAVEEYALTEAVSNGKKWPGFKLVEGRSVRMYSDPKKVEEALLATKAWALDQIYEPKKILGITALEKSIGKASFNDTVGPFLIKPQGKPCLVPESDKRPELNSLASAVADFAEAID